MTACSTENNVSVKQTYKKAQAMILGENGSQRAASGYGEILVKPSFTYFTYICTFIFVFQESSYKNV